MQDYISIAFMVMLGILTLVLTIVGAHLVVVLTQFRRTMKQLESTLAMAENKVSEFTMPLKQLGGAAAGIQTGLKVFELFVGWLHRDEKDNKDD
jgi:hypothetical protein